MKVNPWATMLAKCMAFLGVFLGLLYSFGGLIVDLLTVGLNWGTAMAFGALIIMPIALGTVGFICGLISHLIMGFIKKQLA